MKGRGRTMAMATNNVGSYVPQPQLSVTEKQIEIITISDDDEDIGVKTNSLDSHKSHDHNIPNSILDSFTNSQEITVQKSCIVQKRESVVRKLIETISISDDEDEDPTHTSQNQDFSSSKSHQIPACLTNWKTQKANLDEKSFGGPEYQSVLLNLTDLPNAHCQQTSVSKSAQPNITQKSGTEASFQCNWNQNESERNISVIHGPNIPKISVIKDVMLEAAYVPVIKSENTVLNTDPDPEAFENEAQHDDDASPATDVKEQVVNSSEHRSKTMNIGHATDQVESTNISEIVEGLDNILPNKSSWKINAKKSCSGHRGALKRKPIPTEIRNILNDKDDPTSLESQKSYIPYPIPDTATRWRKWKDSLDKNLGRTKRQEADLNLTPVDKSGSHPSSKCGPILTDAVRKSKALLTHKVTQRNTSATTDTGVTVLGNSALNQFKLDASGQVSEKSGKTVCGVPKGIVEHAPVELAANAEIASSSKNVMPSKLLAKDAVNAKFQNQERRPTHSMGLRKTTMKKCLAQKQQQQRSGDDSGSASTLTTRKPLLPGNQKKGQHRARRPLLPHNKNLTRVILDSGKFYYICVFCKKTFETHTRGKLHVRVHTGDKPYKCSRCGQMFSQKESMKNHQTRHPGKHQFKCKFCTKIFLHWCSRRKHQNICANKKN